MAFTMRVPCKAQGGVARRAALFLLLACLAFCAFVAASDLPAAEESVVADVQEAEVVEGVEPEPEMEGLPEMEAEAALSVPEQAAEKTRPPVGKIVAVGALVALALLLLRGLFGKVSHLWG